VIGTSDESIQGRFAKRNIQVSIVDQPTYEFAGVLFVSGHAFDSEQLVVCTQLQHILGDSLLRFSPMMVLLKNTSQQDTIALLALMESLKNTRSARTMMNRVVFQTPKEGPRGYISNPVGHARLYARLARTSDSPNSLQLLVIR
jgi:hypothetical protein